MFSTAEVTDEQLHAMWGACNEMASQPDTREAYRHLSERLSEIISAPTIVFRREVSPWKLVVTSNHSSSAAASPPTIPGPLTDLVPAAETPYAPFGASPDQLWTPVPLDEESPSQALLLLPGDWRTGAGAAWLPRFARTASMALRLSAARQAARRGEALAADAYAFARRLGHVSGHRALHQFIIDTAARAVGARLGGLSLYDPKEGAISVSATHGYPSEVVGHVRIVPGSGIIGGVFSSKKPLLVRDTTRVPGLTPRSQRYRTSSFMALPIVGGHQALGVVTLADRRDGLPFTRDDLGVTRVIAALSSLAIAREQLSRLSDELAHTAATDPLTTLFNRRYLQTRLEAELERSRRTGMPVALLMIDVDRFKTINDQLGHPSGDAVLRKIAEIIRRSVRASDVCTRYGGDEFAVIVAENAVSATPTAERIRQRIEATRWDAMGIPKSLPVTVSVGVGIGEVGESADSLIGRSDQHLYQAKAAGRNMVFPAEP